MYDVESLLEQQQIKAEKITFYVKCKDLQVLFFDLKKFLAKTELTNTLGVSVKDGVMSVRASAATHYRFDIDLEEVEDVDSYSLEFQNNYIFTDLEKLLPGSGLMAVTMAGTFMTFKHKTRLLRLAASMTELPVIDFNRKWTLFDDRALVTSLNKLRRLQPLNKYYKRNPPMLMGEDYMQELYNCIYVQAPAPDLEGLTIEPTQMQMLKDIILDYGLANTFNIDEMSDEDLEEMGDTDDIQSLTCMYAEDETSLVFRFGNKYLALPKNVGAPVSNLALDLDSFNFVQEVKFGYLGSELKKLLQSAGGGDVTVSITTGSVLIEKQLLGNTFKLCIGDEDCKELSIQFTYKLELLTPIIEFLGDVFSVYKRGEVLCLKAENYLIMMSYLV